MNPRRWDCVFCVETAEALAPMIHVTGKHLVVIATSGTVVWCVWSRGGVAGLLSHILHTKQHTFISKVLIRGVIARSFLLNSAKTLNRKFQYKMDWSRNYYRNLVLRIYFLQYKTAVSKI